MAGMVSTYCQNCSRTRPHYRTMSQRKCAGKGEWFHVSAVMMEMRLLMSSMTSVACRF